VLRNCGKKSYACREVALASTAVKSKVKSQKSKVKSQKSKVLWSKLFRDFKWVVYLRRPVLVSTSIWGLIEKMFQYIFLLKIILTPEF
jgi:hypothetical protein